MYFLNTSSLDATSLTKWVYVVRGVNRNTGNSRIQYRHWPRKPKKEINSSNISPKCWIPSSPSHAPHPSDSATASYYRWALSWVTVSLSLTFTVNYVAVKNSNKKGFYELCYATFQHWNSMSQNIVQHNGLVAARRAANPSAFVFNNIQ